jgi:hypothetical protein
MKKTSTPLERLIVRAREAAVTDQLAAEHIVVPAGFATRVVALAARDFSKASIMALIERRALRALALAGGVAALAVVVNLQSVTQSIEEELMTAHDPVVTLLDLS